MRPKLMRRQLRLLQGQLAASLPRLSGAGDPEALHDLRVALRRLRALLRPLAKRAAIAPVFALTGEVLAATGPLRDLDVLAGDLAAHRRGGMARTLLAHRGERLDTLLGSPALIRLQALVAGNVPLLARPALPGRRKLRRRMARRLARDRDALRARLSRTETDLHEVRIDIKHLRYQLEARGHGGRAGRRLLGLLVKAQATLGDWHDRELWMARAADDPALASCVPRWRREHAGLAADMAPLLAALRRALDVTPATVAA